MEQAVRIKGSAHGMRLEFREDASFDECMQDLKNTLSSSGAFFRNARMAVELVGRRFTSAEEDAILRLIETETEGKVFCILDEEHERARKEAVEREIAKELKFLEEERRELRLQKEELEKAWNRAKEELRKEAESLASNVYIPEGPSVKRAEIRTENLEFDEGRFYKGTLRSGQSLSSDTSMIVLGDINPGATVIAKENIVILGALKGTAVAGADGNDTAFVVAMDMAPMQIQIGDHIARGDDSKKKRSKGNQVRIAYVDQGNIYIEEVSRKILSDIHYKQSKEDYL